MFNYFPWLIFITLYAYAKKMQYSSQFVGELSIFNTSFLKTKQCWNAVCTKWKCSICFLLLWMICSIYIKSFNFFQFFLLNGFFALWLSIWKFLPSPSVELFKRGISQGATRSRGVLNSSKQDMPIFSLWVEPTKLNKVEEGVSSWCLWPPESLNLALAKTNHVSY